MPSWGALCVVCTRARVERTTTDRSPGGTIRRSVRFLLQKCHLWYSSSCPKVRPWYRNTRKQHQHNPAPWVVQDRRWCPETKSEQSSKEKSRGKWLSNKVRDWRERERERENGRQTKKCLERRLPGNLAKMPTMIFPSLSLGCLALHPPPTPFLPATHIYCSSTATVVAAAAAPPIFLSFSLSWENVVSLNHLHALGLQLGPILISALYNKQTKNLVSCNLVSSEDQVARLW